MDRALPRRDNQKMFQTLEPHNATPDQIRKKKNINTSFMSNRGHYDNHNGSARK